MDKIDHNNNSFPEMNENSKSVEEQIYSTDINEIISRRPNWVIRYGMLLFFVIISLIVATTFIIEYPDVITAPVEIVGSKLPNVIVPKTDGHIEELYVQPNELVEKGDLLARLQSTSKYEHIVSLENWFDSTLYLINHDLWDEIVLIPFLDGLGDLQDVYQQLQDSYYQLNLTKSRGYYSERKSTILNRRSVSESLKSNIETQKSLVSKDYELSKQNYQAYEKLSKEKIIAPIELNKDKSILLSKEQQLAQIDAGFITNKLAEITSRQEILEIDKTVNDTRQNFYNLLINVKNRLNEWKNKYLITATQRGFVQPIILLQENTWIKQSQELFYIIPEESNYFGKMTTNQKNIGKLKLGQQVKVKLLSYPSEEFGELKGFIEYIPSIPTKDSGFVINIRFPNNGITSYNRKISLINGLIGTAIVITDNQLLAEKLFLKSKDLINN